MFYAGGPAGVSPRRRCGGAAASFLHKPLAGSADVKGLNRSFLRRKVASIAAGPSCRQSASRGERQEYLKSARKPVVLPGNVPRSRRRLQPESLKTKTLSVDTMTRRRKWPRSCHSLPFSAISGHFVKKTCTSPGNLFCFNHFARPWPLTSRRAALPSIQAPESADFRPRLCPAI